MTEQIVLTVQCEDRPGIVKAVSNSIFEFDGNILESAQFSSPSTNQFCLRMQIEFSLDGLVSFESKVRDQLSTFDPSISIRSVNRRRKVILMVSKADHCLVDILYHWKAGELPVDIGAIVSNHNDLKQYAENYGLPFVYLPITAESKSAQESKLKELMTDSGADFIVLARYMQILSDEFCSNFPGRIINIHHSFLPGFKGAKPYHQAFDRGVKLIGATAHYVTSDLDEGPIIEQDVVRVSHRLDGDDLVKVGRDVERRVLTQAIRMHAEDRVMLTGTRTVIFD